MKRKMQTIIALCLTSALLSGSMTLTYAEEEGAGEKKSMVIGDTTFNSENWEETVVITRITEMLCGLSGKVLGRSQIRPLSVLPGGRRICP